VLLQNLGGPVITFRDHRIEPTMVQQPSSPHVLSTDFDHDVVMFPTQCAPNVPTEFPAQSAGRAATARQTRLRTHAIRQVVVLEVSARLPEVVEELDRAIQLALAEGPRGVVCDLSGADDGADPGAVEMLAMAGRHVRDWPGIPVAVTCPDPQVREKLRAHPLGGHLIVTESIFAAVSAVLSTPTLVVERLRLAAHPTSPSASRNFVTRILKDWQLDRVIPSATVVASRLVASSSLNAGTAIDLSVTWHAGALRLTVADHGPALPDQRPSDPDVQARGLTAAVAGLSRTFGVLPTADGGKLVWAVLDAPRPSPSPRQIRSGRATPTQESPVLPDGRGPAELPSCADSHQDQPEIPSAQHKAETRRSPGKRPGSQPGNVAVLTQPQDLTRLLPH
jgi:hypothetical protein